MTTKLTDSYVERLPLAATPEAFKQGYGNASSYTVGDTDVKGLAIKVGLRDKVWQVAVREVGGRVRKEKVGNYGSVFLGRDPKTGSERTFVLNVANARLNALERIAALRVGRSIVAERRQARKAAEDERKAKAMKSMAENRETLRWLIEKHKNEWVKKGRDGKPKRNSLKSYSTVELHLEDWLDLPFRSVTREAVLDRFNRISGELNRQGTPKKTTANNVFRDLRTVFNNWIAIHPNSGFDNPVAVLAKKWHKTKPRKNWINTKSESRQLSDWWKAVHQEENDTIRDYLVVTLMQGARESETARLEWEHIDFKKNTISYIETKNGEDYVFPMTPHVRNILLARARSADRHERWVFPASRTRRRGDELNHISVPPADAVKRVSKLAGLRWTMHDLRRTFSNTILTLGVEERERDYLLKHVIDDVSIHYEDLALVVAKNLIKFERHVLSNVKARKGGK